MRRIASRSRSAQGARPERGGGAAGGLHERRGIQLPAAFVCKQRDDHAFCGDCERAHRYRGRFAGAGHQARRLHRGGFRRRRRHRRHRPAGALGRHRPQRRRALHLLRQRGVHEHGHPEELADALRREDHHHAGRAQRARVPDAEEERVRDRGRARHSLCGHSKRGVPARLPAQAGTRPRHPRHALHPRDRALPDRLGLPRS